MTACNTQSLVERLTREGLIGLTQAARKLGHVQAEQRPTPKLMRRWCARGWGGAKLEHVLLGKRYRTSWPAVLRFVAAMQRSSEPTAATRKPTQDARRARNNLAKLARLGLIEASPRKERT